MRSLWNEVERYFIFSDDGGFGVPTAHSRSFVVFYQYYPPTVWEGLISYRLERLRR